MPLQICDGLLRLGYMRHEDVLPIERSRREVGMLQSTKLIEWRRHRFVKSRYTGIARLPDGKQVVLSRTVLGSAQLNHRADGMTFVCSIQAVCHK